MKLQTEPVAASKVRTGDLIDLEGDAQARHKVNQDVFTPPIEASMAYEFGEVLAAEKTRAGATVVLFHFGELRFESDHELRRYREP